MAQSQLTTQPDSTPNSPAVVRFVAATVALSGILLLAQTYLLRFGYLRRLDMLAPLSYLGLTRLIRLSLGFALLYVSLNLSRRRLVAWIASTLLVTATLVVEVVAHVPLADMSFMAFTLIILLLSAKQFYVRSEPANLRRGVLYSGVALVIALTYGSVGFVLLDKRDFAREITPGQAVVSTIEQTFLLGNPELVPRTRDARWFLDSLSLVGLLSFGFIAINLFRPLREGLTHPLEVRAAKRIIRKWGRSSQDYFKLWPSKLYSFAPGHEAVVAYGVHNQVALAFEDPIGSKYGVAASYQAFDSYCRLRGYIPAYLNAWPDQCAAYEKLGYRVVQIGETGTVNLEKFVTETVKTKALAYVERRFGREGYRLVTRKPPYSAQYVQELRNISDDWLGIPGRHEEGFSLGYFDADYLNDCEVFCLVSAEGRTVAFANLLPTIGPDHGDVSLDMMRHRLDAPNSSMDALFILTMKELQGRGHKTFNLGLAALSGLDQVSDKQLEEHLMASVYERFNQIFSFKGLRAFKDKFDPDWEPRYLAYRGLPTDLLRVALAYSALSKVGPESLQD